MEMMECKTGIFLTAVLFSCLLGEVKSYIFMMSTETESGTKLCLSLDRHSREDGMTFGLYKNCTMRDTSFHFMWEPIFADYYWIRNMYSNKCLVNSGDNPVIQLKCERADQSMWWTSGANYKDEKGNYYVVSLKNGHATLPRLVLSRTKDQQCSQCVMVKANSDDWRAEEVWALEPVHLGKMKRKFPHL